MKRKVFAICDTEEAYALRLSEYILDKVRLPYTLHLFTKVEELQKFAGQEEIAVLVIAESALKLLREEYVRRQIARMFVLREDEMSEETETDHGLQDNTSVGVEINCAAVENKLQYISKFQSPENIVAILTESITDLSDWKLRAVTEDTEMKLIGIYSPVKRCLQTSFALTMGQILAKEHRVLYFNFENYSGFGQMLKRDFAMDMMDLMYYFRCDREKMALRLPAVTQNMNGLDYIPPMQSYAGRREVTGEEWLELCRCIAGIGQYEYIILDLDDCMDGLFDLLRSCYKIYTITKEDSFAVAKINQYEQILHFNEMEEIVEKTVKCRFPVFRDITVDLNLMTHGELAGYVKAIIREDLYGK
ncbi:MAG: hypothetical protein HDR13_08185 [Lachnospiraceae bacterium]|nr:hypothetical protein [Lachnospiraceae bacterium]